MEDIWVYMSHSAGDERAEEVVREFARIFDLISNQS